VINELLIITKIGERGVMKKIISLALILGLFTFLGACDQNGGGDAGTNGASPSPAESPTNSPSP
jgi:hypothetical protein